MKKYIEALETLNWSVILEGAKKEASRQYSEMAKWLEHQETNNAEGLSALGFIPEAIKKAKSYRGKIYNDGKVIRAVDKELMTATDPEEVKKLQDKRAKYEFHQWDSAGRVLKIYTLVISNVSLTMHDELEDHRTPVEDMYEEGLD